MLTCSIGIMAYNEEANIGRLINVLLNQKMFNAIIKEIVVVASGCTDSTETIVKDYLKKDDRIKLLIQERREGKASAINLFLSKAQGEIIILESGDTIPAEDAIENLVRPFLNPLIGMTGGHPIPLNSKDNFIGFTVGLLWRMHHRIALNHPKMGELIAFRNIVKKIPYDTAVDEASIEAIISSAGLKLHYVDDAIVYNKGAENVRDFLKQRRRISAGHLYVKNIQNYAVSTTSWKYILKSLIKEFRWGLRESSWTIGAVFLEVFGRFLGYYDFIVKKRNPYIWDIAVSTKEL